MKFIEDKNFTYVINPEVEGSIDGKPYKGVVVCKTRFGKSAVKDKLMEDMRKALPQRVTETLNIRYFPFSFEESFNGRTNKPFVGKAYCFTEDTFDEKIGMMVARKKALNKMEYCRLKMLNNISFLIESYKNYLWAERTYRCDNMIKYMEEDE